MKLKEYENEIRPQHDIETFTKLSKQNKDFRYGDLLIRVDTNDFSRIVYDDIIKEILKLI